MLVLTEGGRCMARGGEIEACCLCYIILSQKGDDNGSTCDNKSFTCIDDDPRR